jgi:fermentation-respiration switch protein FrsA (DUF1100 family)
MAPKVSSRRRKTILWSLSILLLLYAGLRWFEYTHVYHPSKNFRKAANPPGHPFQDIYFTSADGLKLNGWFYPGATNSSRGRFAVLVCHGNGGNISYLKDLSGRLLETGAAILLFDYRGYGRSEGRPGESGTYKDSEAAYQWLRQAGFASTNIFAYGQSLGGGIASELALREPLGGLALESTYTSLPDMGALLYPWLPAHLLSTIKYDTFRRLPQIKIPVLIMHSKGDSLIPYELAERNFTVANEPKLFWKIRGTHAAGDDGCRTGMEKFLTAIETARTNASAKLQFQ